jgi:RNA polymerase sigma factor (sigma-70 family)
MGGSDGSPGDPDLDRERDLHQRLLAGDPPAPAELAETYLPELLTWLRRRFPAVDPHLLETVAIDSVLGLSKAPERYDPRLGRLRTYLSMDARGDVLNALQAEQRRAAHRAPLEAVELGPRARNIPMEGTGDPAELVLRTEEAGRVAELCRDLNPRDREGMLLMADGERRTEAFAEVLGWTQLPRADQAREVKRWKDRMLKRLQRRAAQRGDDA